MQTNEVKALGLAVEQLYTTFAPYAPRPHVEGCPCCMTAADDALIHSKPLRSLTAQDLARFAWTAMTTWGEADDFKHFLPRLLEVLAFEELHDAPEPLTGKLLYAGWRSWPAPEQRAIDVYFTALWRAVLATYHPCRPSHRLSTSINAFVVSGKPLTTLGLSLTPGCRIRPWRRAAIWRNSLTPM